MATPEGTFRGWVPEPYLDEVVPEPEPRPTPDAWLVVRNGVTMLAGWGKEDETVRAVAEGERLTFYSLTDYPSVTLRFRGPGDYSVEGEVPAGAMVMVRYDTDTISQTIADMVEDYDAGDAGTYEVLVYHWCDGASFMLREGCLVVAGRA